MRSWLFIFFSLIYIFHANGQRRLGIVDVDFILPKLIVVSKLDSLEEVAKDTLLKRSSKWKGELGTRMSNIQSHFDGSPKDWKNIEYKFELEIGDLKMLDQIIEDSLPSWRKAVLSDFDILIHAQEPPIYLA